MSSNQDPKVSGSENQQPNQPKMNSTEERPKEKRSRENSKTHQQKRQEDYITEGVKAKINRHRMIEEQTRPNVYEIIRFAICNKRDMTSLLLRDWITENIQYSGIRIIILIHTGKQFGFEWNAYDLVLRPIWQTIWEKVLSDIKFSCKKIDIIVVWDGKLPFF